MCEDKKYTFRFVFVVTTKINHIFEFAPQYRSVKSVPSDIM